MGQLFDRYGRGKVLLVGPEGALASLLLASANVVVLVLLARVLFGLMGLLHGGGCVNLSDQ